MNTEPIQIPKHPTLEMLEEKRKDVEDYRLILARYAKKNNSRWYYLGRDELKRREDELLALEEAFLKSNKPSF